MTHERSSPDIEGLLPCPFCGSAPVTERTGFSGRAMYVYCINDNGCPRPKAVGETVGKAIENWNLRSPSEPFDVMATIDPDYAESFERSSAANDSVWTPQKFWEYVEGLTDSLVRDQIRDMLASTGLTITNVAQPPSVDLMQRVWANLYYNEEDAGNTFQQTLNEVVDWLAVRNALPEATPISSTESK